MPSSFAYSVNVNGCKVFWQIKRNVNQKYPHPHGSVLSKIFFSLHNKD